MDIVDRLRDAKLLNDWYLRLEAADAIEARDNEIEMWVAQCQRSADEIDRLRELLTRATDE